MPCNQSCECCNKNNKQIIIYQLCEKCINKLLNNSIELNIPESARTGIPESIKTDNPIFCPKCEKAVKFVNGIDYYITEGNNSNFFIKQDDVCQWTEKKIKHIVDNVEYYVTGMQKNNLHEFFKYQYETLCSTHSMGSSSYSEYTTGDIDVMLASVYKSEDLMFRHIIKSKENFHIIPQHMLTNDLCKIYFLKYKTVNGIPPSLINDEMIKECINNTENALDVIPSSMVTEEYCHLSIKYYPSALKYVPTKFKTAEMIKYATEQYLIKFN